MNCRPLLPTDAPAVVSHTNSEIIIITIILYWLQSIGVRHGLADLYNTGR